MAPLWFNFFAKFLRGNPPAQVTARPRPPTPPSAGAARRPAGGTAGGGSGPRGRPAAWRPSGGRGGPRRPGGEGVWVGTRARGNPGTLVRDCRLHQIPKGIAATGNLQVRTRKVQKISAQKNSIKFTAITANTQHWAIVKSGPTNYP